MAVAAMCAGVAMAGDCKDPAIGSWALYLPYGSMNAGHAIISRDAKGEPQATVLLRWSSPERCPRVELAGDTFKLYHPWGHVIEGKVTGDEAKCTLVKTRKGKVTWGPKEFVAKRNPPINPNDSTKNAKFGAPIDLLKDGLDGFSKMNKGNFGWTYKDGVLSNRVPGGHGVNIMTKRADFFDFQLDYDVRVPARSNSGVYLRGRYEIQTFDSYGHKPDCHNMAALYGRITPSCAAEGKPGTWQHVTVKLYRRHLTVVLNDVTIIDDKPVEGVTGGAIDANEFVPGPLYIQGDHSDADYRNMVLRPAVN